jgi:hypothetical protein
MYGKWIIMIIYMTIIYCESIVNLVKRCVNASVNIGAAWKSYVQHRIDLCLMELICEFTQIPFVMSQEFVML